MRQRSNLIILFGIAFFLVGGAIVFLVLNDDDGGNDASSAAGSGQSEVSILVAAGDIEANTLGSDVIANGLLTTKQIPAGSLPVGALTSPAGLENQIFAVPVEKDAVITSAQLATRSLSNVQVPEGYEAVAVTIDYTNGGAGYVAPGDLVNVYGVFGPEGDAGLAGVGSSQVVPRSELVLTNVLVLDVSAQQATSLQGADTTQGDTIGRQTLSTPLTYLLALKATDVERVVQLTSFADMYLSLTSDGAAPTGDTPGVSGENVGNTVSDDSAAPRS